MIILLTVMWMTLVVAMIQLWRCCDLLDQERRKYDYLVDTHHYKQMLATHTEHDRDMWRAKWTAAMEKLEAERKGK